MFNQYVELYILRETLSVFFSFFLAPAVAPGRADDPVPEGDLTPTSVRLVWDPLDPDDANGELTYNVCISVRGQSVESRRKQGEAVTNKLDQCLAAAGIMPPLCFTVPGDQTSLAVNNIGRSIFIYCMNLTHMHV